MSLTTEHPVRDAVHGPLEVRRLAGSLGAEIRDVFSQFLIQTELRDTSLISLSTASASPEEVESELALATTSAKTWNYFIDQPIGTTLTW